MMDHVQASGCVNSWQTDMMVSRQEIDKSLRRAFPSAIQRAPRPTRIDSKIASDHENRSLIPRHRPLLHLTSPPLNSLRLHLSISLTVCTAALTPPSRR